MTYLRVNRLELQYLYLILSPSQFIVRLTFLSARLIQIFLQLSFIFIVI